MSQLSDLLRTEQERRDAEARRQIGVINATARVIYGTVSIAKDPYEPIEIVPSMPKSRTRRMLDAFWEYAIKHPVLVPIAYGCATNIPVAIVDVIQGETVAGACGSFVSIGILSGFGYFWINKLRQMRANEVMNRLTR